MGFFGSLFKAHITNAVGGIQQLLIEFDPETASQAQVNEMISVLEKTNSSLARLKIDLDAKQREIDGGEKSIHDNITAADILMKAGKEDKAKALLDQIDNEFALELGRDREDLASIQASITQYEESRRTLESKLSTAKSRLANARRDMERSDLERRRAEEIASEQKEHIGLARSIGGLDAAATAFEVAAAKNRAAAEAARLNAESFRKASSGIGMNGDPDVTSALAEARGAAQTSTMSVADRLAAMKAKQNLG